MLLRSDVLAALAVSTAIGLAVQSDLAHEAAQPEAPTEMVEPVSFATEVMPILEQYCWECHSEESAELGLKLDTYEGVMAGSDYGTVVEAGDADASILFEMVEAGDMPEEGDPLTPEELELIRTWITEGAPHAEHWAFVATLGAEIPAWVGELGLSIGTKPLRGHDVAAQGF